MHPRKTVLFISACLLPALAFGQAQPKPWTQEQLNETYMRTLSKQQCMEKTIASLTAGCSTDQCLKTLGGISGDCITWATGELQQFCKTYDQAYIAKYCATNELDARRCLVLHIGKSVHCKQPATAAK